MRARRFVVVVAWAAIAGCGGSGGGKPDGGGGGSAGGGSGGGGTGESNVDAAVNGSCTFTACGGDVVGTWHAVSTCGTIPSDACPPSQAVTSQQSATQATYTFAGDGTFVFSASGGATQTTRYPSACIAYLNDGGLTPACTALDEQVREAIQMIDAGTSIENFTLSCAVEGTDTCLCSGHYDLTAPVTRTGTYAVSGDQITVTSPDGGAGNGPADYCVSGNTLTLRTVGSAGNQTIVTLTR